MKEVKKRLPQGWRWENLSTLCANIEYGYTASASKNPVGPKLLRITDIESGEINWDSVPYCECSEADKQKYRLNDGDIVFARTGSTGNSCLIKSPPEAIFASFLIRIKLNQKLASPEYVLKFFKSPLYWRVMNKQMRGGIQKGFNASMLAEMQVPIPEYTKEQENIAGKLDIKISQAEKMRQAALKQKEAISAMKGAILREVFPYKEGDKLPQGWKWASLGDTSLVTLIMGQSPPSETYNKEQKGLPFFQGCTDFGRIHPEPSVWCSDPNRIAEPNDILMSVRAPVGPTNIAKEKCCIGRGIAAIRCKEGLFYKYLIWVLQKFEREICSEGSGSVFGAIGKDKLKAVRFPIPLDIKEQINVANKLNEKNNNLEEMNDAINKKLDAVKAMQGAILREVFDFQEINN